MSTQTYPYWVIKDVGSGFYWLEHGGVDHRLKKAERYHSLDSARESLEKYGAGQNPAKVVRVVNKKRQVSPPTLKVLRATVRHGWGTDKVILWLDTPTTFPLTSEPPHTTLEARKGCGVEWCRTVLGIEPRVVQKTTKVDFR